MDVHGKSLCPENRSSSRAVGALSGAPPGSSRLRTGVVLFVTGQILIFHVICVEAICRALGVLPVMAIENEGRSAGRLRAGDVHPRACAAHQLSEYKIVEVHCFYSSINVIPAGAVADVPCQAPGLPGSNVAMGAHTPFDPRVVNVHTRSYTLSGNSLYPGTKPAKSSSQLQNDKQGGRTIVNLNPNFG